MSQQSDPYHYSDIDPEYLQYYIPVYITTTSISLVANLTVIGFHWLMTWYKVAEFNRVSLRLIVLASLIDMVRSIVRLSMGVPADTVACMVDSFFLGWTEIAAPLCLGLVGLHAVCVLVLNVKNPLRLEKYYYMVILTYSFIASLVTVTHRNRNYPEDFYCWVRFYFGSKARSPFAWIWYFTLLLLPMTLAAFCSLTLVIRYRMERHNFVETSVRYAQNNNPYLLPAIPHRRRRVDPIKTFRNLVIRSAFYAMIPLISKIFLVISGLTSLRGYSTNFYALMIGGVITNLQGLLISILYFSDPAVTFTIRRLGWFLRRVYVDEYQLPNDKLEGIGDDLQETGGYDKEELRSVDGSEDDIGGAIRITHDKHDMIVAETSAIEPSDGYHHCWRQHDGQTTQGLPQHYQRIKMDNTRRMQDPYRYQWLAKTTHFFLTSVCRLKPLPPTSSDSTSTLSYHSRALSRLSASRTPISSLRLTNSSVSGSQLSSVERESTQNNNNTIGNSDSNLAEDKERVPAVRFDMTTAEKRDTTTASSLSSDYDHQQLLALPTKTEAATLVKPRNVSPHDSTYSNGQHLIPSSSSSTSLLDNSDVSDIMTDHYYTKARKLGKPSPSPSPTPSPLALSSSKFAQHSKKLGQVMLHRPETSHIVQSLVDPRHLHPQPQQKRKQSVAFQVSPPSPTLYPMRRRFTAASLATSSSFASRHLSMSSSAEDQDIDRLSLLSYAKSIDQPSPTETYEPLSAPPHYYQYRRQHHQQQTTTTMISPPPQLSITLPDQQQQQQQPSSPPSSTSSISSSTLSTTTTMDWTPQQPPDDLPRHKELKHGVALAPAVLKTLLDWGGPAHPTTTTTSTTTTNSAGITSADLPILLASDGLEYGYTHVTHIQHSWSTSTHGISPSSSSNSSRRRHHRHHHDDDSSSSRLVFFVEHWVKGYLGSRWFVVE